MFSIFFYNSSALDHKYFHITWLVHGTGPVAQSPPHICISSLVFIFHLPPHGGKQLIRIINISSQTFSQIKVFCSPSLLLVCQRWRTSSPFSSFHPSAEPALLIFCPSSLSHVLSHLPHLLPPPASTHLSICGRLPPTDLASREIQRLIPSSLLVRHLLLNQPL